MASDHMGVPITAASLRDGSLLAALDPKTSPERALGDGAVVTAAPAVGALGVPVVTALAATTGGTLPAGTYVYSVTAIGVDGEGDLSNEVSATTTGTTGKVTLSWPAVAGETGGFRVYGRTAGDEEHMADVPHGTLTWVDNGSIVPAGMEPANVEPAGDAGELEGHLAPQPVDAGADASEEEGGTPPQAGETA